MTQKTWSQQQLATKLHLDRAEKQGLLSWERRHTLIHAAKTAFAAGLCWWLAVKFRMHEGYWGAITAIIVLQSNFGSTIGASRDRLLGTVIGAVFGFTFSLVDALPWTYILAVLSAVAVCGLLGLRSSARLAGVTVTIIMLVDAGSRWTLALNRVLQVVLGIVIALTVSTLIFPDRARLRLRDGLAEEFLILGSFFEAILQGFQRKPAENLPTERKNALAVMGRNNQLLREARDEPSGGPGWREGLSTLSQFGRSIFDALVALELAVQGNHDNSYIHQLEPSLGKLTLDIQSGFHYVAGCIHHWRFHVPPHIDLPEDIAQLEANMDAVRHTESKFSQPEILRAYAVLLHLKQIARLLRESRVETSRAIGEVKE